MREPARTSPRPLAISLARRISRESDSNDRRFLYLVSFPYRTSPRIHEGKERERERDVCRKGNVYVDVDGNEYLGLISFSSDRRGGLNFIREYMIEESGSMRGVNRMLCR